MQQSEKEKLRDYDQYILWQTIHLLRGLKVMDKLTPAQYDYVKSHSELIAATIREDRQQAIQEAYKKGYIDGQLQKEKSA